MSDEANHIRIGIAGWSYPDWENVVYPPGTRDRLAFIAPYVDLIEINSTFYRIPAPRTVQSWCRRTQPLPDFSFAAKLHQDITHKGTLEPAAVDAFRTSLAPLLDGGRLRHLLAQFRYDFSDTPETRNYLRRIRDSFSALTTLTLELRHKSWESEDALAFLACLGVTVANLDYPTTWNSFCPDLCAVGDHAYFRLHGRNTRAWFNRKAGRDETYNYLYSPPELKGIAQRAARIATQSRSLTVVANNHYRGKEIVNALELKALLTGRKVPAPPSLLRAYPRLASSAANRPDTLPGLDMPD